MSASQFEESSISKLMAGAILMDGECSDVPFPWNDNSVPSSPALKMERDSFPPNVDCWNMQNHTPSYSNNFPFGPQTNGFGPIQQNGSMISNGEQCHGQNGLATTNSPLKPMQDQFRQKYGNYSNEKYPDFNIAVKAETCENKWNTCAMTSNQNTYDNVARTNVISDDQFSPKSFKSLDNGGTDNAHALPSSGENSKKGLFDCGESDSDSKASGTDTSSQNGNREWQCNFGPPVEIDVSQMINSGVTVAGYKPRKIICKRKKSNVPSEAKDPGYWEKRKKNNDSARRSREAKKEKERNFYKRALELEYENHCLKERVSYLERKLEMLMQQNPNFTCNDV